MKDFILALNQANVGKVLLDEPLSNHTTWKIGGPADVMVQPRDKNGLIQLIRLINDYQLPFFVLGRGSNILVRDGGIRGVVIKLGEGLSHLQIEGSMVTVGAGYSLIKLATSLSRKGFKGLEFAGGIPGTVGGAVYMNAGAHGSDISRILHSAQILLADGQVRVLTNAEMKYAYRTSVLQEELSGICLEACFRLEKGNVDGIMKRMSEHKQYRRQTQPLAEQCCGSVFRNPRPHSAGQLIEEAGLKGYRLGDAQISLIHANFIINAGQATAADVLSLIQHVQQVVQQQFNIQLRTEVQVIGEG